MPRRRRPGRVEPDVEGDVTPGALRTLVQRQHLGEPTTVDVGRENHDVDRSAIEPHGQLCQRLSLRQRGQRSKRRLDVHEHCRGRRFDDAVRDPERAALYGAL